MPNKEEVMVNKVKNEAELQAWDQYAAAAIATAYNAVHGNNAHDYVLKATQRAAEIADALIEERRKR
ncbi:hypothetical protein K7402_05150 [Pseudomonas fluorescens group sp.]|uniref:Uncharacterized protein n=1 Tax=Pseudomonas fluorescens TaxID=294 RepID=A0ACD4Y0L6_PSEFL|nr:MULTISPECIES: hypothetical protein [Pseudomonas fluorescens group]MBZ6453929.1 hypothetical protein [Pseudomonas fluorescens group sp.]MBZ6459915.1 hypothetical protein [Pseudomonas fluorescens group sp.]MBZ6466806.1 hypothetical protein [Pseudomonas fluorescens group sp.]WQD75089.1 hypothetical protein U0037_14440 [Pseudomonas marginalis]